MNVSCLQENLAKGLSAVSHAVATKGSLPVLANILLRTEGGRLRLAATNLETSIVTWVGAKVEEEGELTVPARLLSDLVNSLDSGKLSLSTETQILSVKTENAFSRINGIAAEEFPTFPTVTGDPVLEIGSELFSTAAPLVTFSTATDEGRPILTGVLLRSEGGRLILVGVDGFRLSEKTVTVSRKSELPLTAVIPARTLNEVARLMSEKDVKIEVFLSEAENQVVFRTPDCEVYSRLIEGEFPDYQKIIPRSFTTEATFFRDPLMKALRSASIFAKDSASVVRLRLDPSAGKITLSANTAEVGENETLVEGEITGTGGEMAFNSKYLIDCLSRMSGEKIILKCGDALNPVLLQPENDKNYLHIIMPVRIQN